MRLSRDYQRLEIFRAKCDKRSLMDIFDYCAAVRSHAVKSVSIAEEISRKNIESEIESDDNDEVLSRDGPNRSAKTCRRSRS